MKHNIKFSSINYNISTCIYFFYCVRITLYAILKLKINMRTNHTAFTP